MGVIKNSFTSADDHGIKGIIRRFTDIYLAVFKLEKNYTKAKERGGYITAYVPEKRGYVTQYGYIADIQPTFYSVAHGKIKYDPIKFSFVGGVYDK